MTTMDSANNERWKSVRGTKYEVSTLGRVRNKKTGRILKPMMTGARRPGGQTAKVRFSTNPRIDYSIADLVLSCFVSVKPVDHVAMHKDDDRTNNKLSNLSWGTHRQNVVDMVRKGRGGNQTLQLSQVQQIIARRNAGESGRQLAAEFGVSEQRICDIFKGRTCLS